MSNELVSVIMPSYNTSQYIAQSIQSVIDQTYKNWELIIVDDCSTDNTDEIIMSFDDDRIRYFKNESNSGAAISRNRALQEAKGKWVAFLDSDDLWLPQKLEKQIDFMEKNEYKFTYTAYKEMTEKGIPNGVFVTGPKRINKRKMFNYCWLGCLTVMYDANCVGNIQIADLKKNNDYAMWLKCIKKTECVFLNEDLSYYRLRNGSISHGSKWKLIKHHYLLYRIGENKGIISSAFSTIRNLLWGAYKKIRYVHRL